MLTSSNSIKSFHFEVLRPQISMKYSKFVFILEDIGSYREKRQVNELLPSSGVQKTNIILLEGKKTLKQPNLHCWSLQASLLTPGYFSFGQIGRPAETG